MLVTPARPVDIALLWRAGTDYHEIPTSAMGDRFMSTPPPARTNNMENHQISTADVEILRAMARLLQELAYSDELSRGTSAWLGVCGREAARIADRVPSAP